MLRLATAALAGILLLSGCSDDGPDAGDPMSTWTPSGTIESSSPSPTDPLTAAPDGETARQFIQRWVALSNRMQETGDTAAFLSVAGPDCTSCHDYAARIEKIYENEGHVSGGRERILSLKSESPTQWLVTLRAEPTRFVEAEGSAPENLPGGKYRSRLYLARVGGKWIVGSTEGVPL